MVTRTLLADGEIVVRRFHSGWWYASGHAHNSTQFGNGECSAMPFEVGEPVTLDRIGLYVETAGSAGSVVRLGIYTADGDNLPDQLVLDAGTVDGTGTGERIVTISQALTPALYFLVAAGQAAPATQPFLRCNQNTMGHHMIGDPLSSTIFAGSRNGYYKTGFTGALPGTFGAPSGSTYTSFTLIVRVA